MVSRSKKSVYEVSLRFKSSHIGISDILKEMLQSIRIPSHKIVELQQHGTCSLLVYFENLKQVNTFKKRFKLLNLKHVAVDSKYLRTKDWETKWKDDYKRFHLTPRFDVSPPKKIASKKSGRDCVFIDTSIAFGTGLHATTRFMAELIERSEGKFESFLDIGTGTGILSVIALKCGAKSVVAIDLRKDIVKITNENFRTNGFGDVKARAIDFRKFKSKKKYDFVAANLITHDLIDTHKKLLSFVKKDKYLAVSGISLNNYELFRSTFDRLPLRCLKIYKGEGWNALLYKKIRDS